MTQSNDLVAHLKYRPDIDGLRAFAVISVVIFHAFPTKLKGGFVGVDVFFVISGYLISTIILTNLEKSTFSFIDFYSRRIKRIFPALLLVLLSCLIFGWFFLLGDEFEQLGKHVVAGTGFVSNLVLWSESGYFDSSAETKPLLHLWSLGIEEQFYIIWPFLIFLVWRSKFKTALMISTVLSFSVFLNVYGVSKDAVATFYSPLSRFWELIVGSLLAYLALYKHVSQERFSVVQSNIISIVGFSLLLFSVLVIDKNDSYPGWWAVYPVLGAALIISTGNKSWLNKVFLSNKLAVWFGLISFPLYLWHWPLLSFGRIMEGQTPNNTYRIGALIASTLLAWITFRYLERNIRFRTGFVVIALVCASVFLASIGAYVKLNSGFTERPVVKNTRLTKEVRRQFMGPLWSYTKNDICLNKYLFKDADNLAWWFCMQSDKSNPTLIILGNSFANQLYPGFINNSELKHHTVLSIGTCDFTGIAKFNVDEKNPCYGHKAAEQADFINQLVTKERSIKFAIIDGLSSEANPEYVKLLQKRIDFFEAHGIRVVLFTPHLKPDFHPKECFTKRLKRDTRDCTFPLKERELLYQKFMPIVTAISISNPNVQIFEQNEIFCDKSKCSYVRNGMPLHRDEVHTSEYASIQLQEYFSQWAKLNVPEIFDESLVNVSMLENVTTKGNVNE